MSTTADFYHPDVCWIRRALLMALLTHPNVRDADIYLPTQEGKTKVKVPIVRGRLFGGPELIEPGLTLAVYPYHTSYEVTKGVLPDADPNKSVVYSSAQSRRGYTTLGSPAGNKERGYYAQVKLVVQLYYRESSYNQPYPLQAEYVRPEEDYSNDYFGYVFQYTDTLNPGEPTLSQRQWQKPVSVNKVDVQILPAEEVLTQWMDVLKFVIRDIKVLYPYTAVRNPELLFTDFPTSSWSAQDPNLVFHTAYHVVCFEMSDPPILPSKTFPNIQSLLIES